MEESFDTWFQREILEHESLLMRFLARVWPNPSDLADIRQETYVRVYEATQRARPAVPRAFLFTTARHIMTDRLRRERVVSIRTTGETEFLNVLIDELSPERQVSGEQELERLARAMDRLPDQCREVMWLRCVKGLAYQEIADQLGVTSKTVEKHLAAGGRLLAQFMSAPGLSPNARLARRQT